MGSKTISVTINSYIMWGNKPVLGVGDKVGIGKNVQSLYRQRIKNKQVLYRLLKKEFKPTMVVIAKLPPPKGCETATIKPYNF